jgi:hypothetical protein
VQPQALRFEKVTFRTQHCPFSPQLWMAGAAGKEE